jgi:Fe-S-cluster-containing hydrogenase component 2
VNGKAAVDPAVCVGCALCSVCPVGAISYMQLPGLDDLTPEERALAPLGF